MSEVFDHIFHQHFNIVWGKGIAVLTSVKVRTKITNKNWIVTVLLSFIAETGSSSNLREFSPISFCGTRIPPLSSGRLA